MENKQKGWILGYDVKSLPFSNAYLDISFIVFELGNDLTSYPKIHPFCFIY
jgi:hypothetical protein